MEKRTPKDYEELVSSYSPKQLSLIQNRMIIYKVPRHSIPHALKIPYSRKKRGILPEEEEEPMKPPLPGPSPLSSSFSSSSF